MGEARRWYLVTYDIRDEKRWRKAYALLKGWGEHLQYSVFRICLNDRDREKLRWELSQVLDPVDALLVVGICESCVERTNALNPRSAWPEPPPTVVVL
jgi:CRISPR-associated protein Cas2